MGNGLPRRGRGLEGREVSEIMQTAASQIVKDALEKGRQDLARQMYDAVAEQTNRGLGHPAYNNPQAALSFIDEVRAALVEYEAGNAVLQTAAAAL